MTKREGFQKVYDLAENVIPQKTNLNFPTESEYAFYLINRTLSHHGLASSKQISYLLGSKIKSHVLHALEDEAKKGNLINVSVEGLSDKFYAFKKNLDQSFTEHKNLHILSPFDNMIIQREKLTDFFDYSYLLECYTPAPKRVFGYFSLPVLLNGALVGRVNCRADRKTKSLHLLSLHAEKKSDEEKLLMKVQKNLGPFAAFNGCDRVVYEG